MSSAGGHRRRRSPSSPTRTNWISRCTSSTGCSSTNCSTATWATRISTTARSTRFWPASCRVTWCSAGPPLFSPVLIAIPVGIAQAVRRNGPLDYAGTGISFLLVLDASVRDRAALLIQFLSITFHVFPAEAPQLSQQDAEPGIDIAFSPSVVLFQNRCATSSDFGSPWTVHTHRAQPRSSCRRMTSNNDLSTILIGLLDDFPGGRSRLGGLLMPRCRLDLPPCAESGRASRRRYLGHPAAGTGRPRLRSRGHHRRFRLGAPAPGTKRPCLRFPAAVMFFMLYNVGPLARYLENLGYEAIDALAKPQRKQATAERRHGRKDQSLA